MRYLILLALLSFPLHAAELEAVYPNVGYMVISDKPCTDKNVVAMLKPDAVQYWKSGFAVVEKEKFQICWRESPSDPSLLMMVADNGSYGYVPKSDFSRKKGLIRG